MKFLIILQVKTKFIMLMKKLFLLASFIGCFGANVNAQLNVDPTSGNVAIKTTEVPLSSLSIGGAGFSNFNVYSKSEKCGIYCTTTGNGDNWGNAGEFYNVSRNNNFIVGVRGEIGPVNGPDLNSGRSFGLFGRAGYATSGWNYGVYGQIVGAHNGAGIYGTSNISENGTYIDGRYAGYFNGNTKVVGNLNVTGTVTGLLLGQSASLIGETRNLNSNLENVSNKLSGLTAISYYNDDPMFAKSVVNYGDTIVEEQKLTLIESQNMAKKHFALSADCLEQVYPDLVYVNEDGSKSINYVEMIPLLVQSINELKLKIEELENKNGGETAIIDNVHENELNAVLYQNNPNPFSVSSVVKLIIPNSAKTALMCIYDMTGKQIDKQIISERGNISFTLNSEKLNSGMYLYSLIVDGKIIDTKRMIVSK